MPAPDTATPDTHTTATISLGNIGGSSTPSGPTFHNAGGGGGNAGQQGGGGYGGGGGSGSVTGSINYPYDHDWYRISLSEYSRYTIRVIGSNGFDPTLAIHDRNGDEIAYNDDESNNSNNSRLVLSPDYSGNYYVDVGGYGSSTGDYTVRVSVAPPNITPA
ncbi:DVUA0089 family protein [Rhodovastum atsumiense]|uniref:Peptidase C-terminal archaeal/bacterial domain-containing protein n=1 Tax=Rhodovastum atsumiense TaxID=504468 RepID=A0A5M6IPP9_9PROT|nr:DVUA0089 family protein [Rhodovastum atsumiense]KAA5610254.1 hypothetical protein F1189_19935 [Rhodovastum atsumiense]